MNIKLVLLIGLLQELRPLFPELRWVLRMEREKPPLWHLYTDCRKYEIWVYVAEPGCEPSGADGFITVIGSWGRRSVDLNNPEFYPALIDAIGFAVYREDYEMRPGLKLPPFRPLKSDGQPFYKKVP